MDTPFVDTPFGPPRFLEGVSQWVLKGERVLRRVLRMGSKKGLSVRLPQIRV